MIAMLGTLFSSFFRKSATVRYPLEPKRVVPTARGHIEIDIDACVFCGMCARKCPTGAIEVDRGEKAWAIERPRCMQCNACAENCPKKCLFMRPEPPSIVTAIEKEVVRARVSADA